MSVNGWVAIDKDKEIPPRLLEWLISAVHFCGFIIINQIVFSKNNIFRIAKQERHHAVAICCSL